MRNQQREQFLQSVAASASQEEPSRSASLPANSRRGRGARRGVPRGADRRRQVAVNSRSSATQGSESAPSSRGRGRRSRRARIDSGASGRAVASEMQDPNAEASSLANQETFPGASSAQSPSIERSAESACSICCEPIEITAVGPCNHNLMCGSCCLRMRIHYKDTSCPFCKANMPKVLLTKDSENHSFRDLLGQDSNQLWNKDSWAKGVYIQRGCNLCDKHGDHTFTSHKQLRHHLRSTHGRDLCAICTKAGRCFPLEQETFPDPRQRHPTPQNQVGPSLSDHMKQHPQCEFCNIQFFDKDEIYQHMQRKHCTCHVCERGGLFYQYFRHGEELLEHMRSCHYVCTEGHCIHGFVGFATEEELSAHNMQEHSGRMPRWNSQRSRPLAMEYLNYNVTAALRERGESQADPGVSRARGQNRMRGRGGARTSTNLSSINEGTANPMGIIDTSANFQLIDDNEFPEHHNISNSQGPADPSSSRRLESLEDFPVLPSNSTSGSETVSTSKKLITVHCRCPCGRRKQFPVIEEGKPIPKLECNYDCACSSRRVQLANAFGIEDPSSYVPVPDRTKDVKYPLDLVTWAYYDHDEVQKVEAQITAFVLNNREQKVKIHVTNKPHRSAVESLVEIYGLATRNPGQYSVPFVEALRTSYTALPRISLLDYAAPLSENDLCELNKEMEALKIHFVDVSPGADLRSYLRDFSSEYTLEQKNSTATATFKTVAAYELASAHLVGGRKGQFKIQRETNKNESRPADECSSSVQARKPNGSWIPVTGYGKGWASVVKNDEVPFSDAWDDPSGSSGGNKELGYLVLKRKNRVINKQENDQDEGAPLDLENEWKVLETE